jgi:hypothetical protein
VEETVMPRTALLVAALIVSVPALSPVGQACGDKFLMAGRGARFQRAYASVYPGNVLIYARPSADPKAAIRDPQLHKALRQAGHAVSVIEEWAQLEQALKTGPVDIVLVDVAEAAKLRDLVASSSAHPDTLYIEFASKGKTANPAFKCRLKASDGKLKYLDEIENAMTARTKHAKNS